MGVTHACCGGLFCLVEVSSWYLASVVIPPLTGFISIWVAFPRRCRGLLYLGHNRNRFECRSAIAKRQYTPDPSSTIAMRDIVAKHRRIAEFEVWIDKPIGVRFFSDSSSPD